MYNIVISNALVEDVIRIYAFYFNTYDFEKMYSNEMEF